MDFLIPNSHKKFILKFDTSKLLNINDITKRIGNFFKLPIQLFQGGTYPELALLG